MPAYHLVHPAELIAYAALGSSAASCRCFLQRTAPRPGSFFACRREAEYHQPAIGGLVIGVVLIYSAVMGVGYEYVNQALNGGLLLKTMLLLCLSSLARRLSRMRRATRAASSRPALYIGAMAGGAVGMLVHRLRQFPTGDPGAYALVGMGTLFAGIIRAPMTSVFMIFEITQDYQILVPLMVANMLSFAISRQFQPTPLYHALLEQDHVHLPGSATRRPSARWRARDVMTRDLVMIPPDSSIADAANRMPTTNAQCFMVGNDGILEGLISRDQIQREMQSGNAEVTVRHFVISAYQHVHPDHSLDVVFDRLGQNPGMLPVVSRSDAKHVLGSITPETLIHFVQKHWEENGRSEGVGSGSESSLQKPAA